MVLSKTFLANIFFIRQTIIREIYNFKSTKNVNSHRKIYLQIIEMHYIDTFHKEATIYLTLKPTHMFNNYYIKIV